MQLLILQLPKGLLQQSILGQLATQDLVSFGLTCKAAAAVALHDDKVVWEPRWQQKVRSLPHINAHKWEPFEWGCNSYREAYLKVLHRYGHLLGIWTVLDSCDGGLVIFKPEPPAVIKAYAAVVDQLSDAPLLVPVWEVDVHQPSESTLMKQLQQDEPPRKGRQRKQKPQFIPGTDQHQVSHGRCRCAMMKLPADFTIHPDLHVHPSLPDGLQLPTTGVRHGTDSSTGMAVEEQEHQAWRLASLHCQHASEGGVVQQVTGSRMQMRAMMHDSLAEDDEEWTEGTEEETEQQDTQPDVAQGVYVMPPPEFLTTLEGARQPAADRMQQESEAQTLAKQSQDGTQQPPSITTLTGPAGHHDSVKETAEGAAHLGASGSGYGYGGGGGEGSGGRGVVGEEAGGAGGGSDRAGAGAGVSDEKADDTSYYTCTCSFPEVKYADHAYMFSSSEGDHPSAWRMRGEPPGRGFAHMCGGGCETYAQLPANVNMPQSHPLEGLWRGTYGSHGVEVVWITSTTASSAPTTSTATASMSEAAQQGQPGWWQWFWPQAWRQQIQQTVDSFRTYGATSTADSADETIASSTATAGSTNPCNIAQATSSSTVNARESDGIGVLTRSQAAALAAQQSRAAAVSSLGAFTAQAPGSSDAGASAAGTATEPGPGPSLPTSLAAGATTSLAAGASADMGAGVSEAPAAWAGKGGMLCAIKLVGDPNVPAGAVSLQIDMDGPSPTHPIGHPGQALSLPDRVEADVWFDNWPPNSWKAGDAWWDGALVVRSVHQARGQISGAGFEDPRWIAAEVYTFHTMCDVHGYTDGPSQTSIDQAPASAAAAKKKAAELEELRAGVYGSGKGVRECGGSRLPVQCFGVLWKGLDEFSLFTRLHPEIISAGFPWAGGQIMPV